MNEAAVKMILQHPKWQIIVMAKERKILAEGTKIELAKKIAGYDTKRSERDWMVISGEKKGRRV